MMGWAIIIVLALATFAGLWRWIGRDRGALQFLGAALFLALAGYAWQGHPGLEGRPKPPPSRERLPDSEFAETREDMLGRFDRAAQWLTMAESYQRRGDTQSGAEVIRSGLRANPGDPDLWVGLGNALVIHNDGMMSPAAQLAFQRAAQIAPDHPGPRYFFGLAGSPRAAIRRGRADLAPAHRRGAAGGRISADDRGARCRRSSSSGRMQTPVPRGPRRRRSRRLPPRAR